MSLSENPPLPEENLPRRSFLRNTAAISAGIYTVALKSARADSPPGTAVQKINTETKPKNREIPGLKEIGRFELPNSDNLTVVVEMAPKPGAPRCFVYFTKILGQDGKPLEGKDKNRSYMPPQPMADRAAPSADNTINIPEVTATAGKLEGNAPSGQLLVTNEGERWHVPGLITGYYSANGLIITIPGGQLFVRKDGVTSVRLPKP